MIANNDPHLIALGQLELDRASGKLTEKQYAAAKSKLQAAHREATRPWRIGLLVMVGAPVLLFGGCLAMLAGSAADGTASEGTNRAAVIVKCHESVKRQLKAPKSADFSGDNALSTGVANQFRVTGQVYATNSFGGTVRADWTCVGSATDGYSTAVASARLIE